MRSHNLELDMILRGIIMSRGDRGATIAEMRADYHDIKLEPWPLQYEKTNRIVGYLLQIDGLVMERLENGLCVWYIDDLGNVSQRTQADEQRMKRGFVNRSPAMVDSSAKRIRASEPERVPLSEVNLGIHDERTKSKGVVKKTTSTEVEAISIRNTSNESISLPNSLEIDSQEFRR